MLAYFNETLISKESNHARQSLYSTGVDVDVEPVAVTSTSQAGRAADRQSKRWCLTMDQKYIYFSAKSSSMFGVIPTAAAAMNSGLKSQPNFIHQAHH